MIYETIYKWIKYIQKVYYTFWLFIIIIPIHYSLKKENKVSL